MQLMNVIAKINLLALVYLLNFQENELLLVSAFIAACREPINKNRDIRLQHKYKQDNSAF